MLLHHLLVGHLAIQLLLDAKQEHTMVHVNNTWNKAHMHFINC
jgi:hypothetical protein